jgi:hypothetical protein
VGSDLFIRDSDRGLRIYRGKGLDRCEGRHGLSRGDRLERRYR